MTRTEPTREPTADQAVFLCQERDEHEWTISEAIASAILDLPVSKRKKIDLLTAALGKKGKA